MRTGFCCVTAFAMAMTALPASAQSVSATCTTSVTCAAYKNSSTGVGIHGAANSGIGIRGTSASNTGFYGASGSGSAGSPGVEGESTNGTGNDAAAAFGLAFLSGKPAPAYGAIAYGSSYGIFGEAANPGSSSSSPGYGVFGVDSGMTMGSDYNAGVVAKSTVGTGLLAEVNATPDITFGILPIGVYSAVATSNLNYTALAFYGTTNDYGMEIVNGDTYETYLTPGYFLYGEASGGSYSVDLSGNMTLGGTLRTKGTYVEAKGSSGAKMVEYAGRTTMPEVEDIGEGQLTNGRAFVSIDARLADTIDRRAPYHVFITPEGDSKGLYVTQKSPAGFVVREQQGGRSTLAFEYRIVAKPIGEEGKRLAVAPPEPSPAGADARLDLRSHVPVASPLTPEARMKQVLGPQGYAQAVAAIRKRLLER